MTQAPLQHVTTGLTVAHLAAHSPVNMDFSAHSIIWILVIGLVVGAIAKLLMPGKDPGGCIITILLGIAGAFVANYIGTAIGWFTGRAGRLYQIDRRRDDFAVALSVDFQPQIIAIRRRQRLLCRPNRTR